MLQRTWFIIIVMVAFDPHRLMACGRDELRRFIALAQSLSPETGPAGETLLACPAETVEAAQWLYFYQAVAMKPQGALAGKAATPTTLVPGEVGRDIVAAYTGNYSPLKMNLDQGDPRYSKQAEVHLALARMLMRAGNYTEARGLYEATLRLRSQAEAVEIEYLFSAIWAGNLNLADSSFSAVDTKPDSTEFSNAVDRGRALIKRLRLERSEVAPRGLAANGADDVLLEVKAEAFVLKDQMRRFSSGFDYRGIIDARWLHHVIHVDAYDRPSFNTDEFWVGKEHTFFNIWTLGAHFGSFTFRDKAQGFDAVTRLKLFDTFSIGLGADRRPLFTSIPFAVLKTSPLQDRVYVEGSWGDYLSLRSAYLRDDAKPTFVRHELEWQLPLAAEDESGDRLRLVGRLSQEERQRPSPDYDTYRQENKFGIGALMTRRIGDSWDARAALLYILLRREAIGASTVSLRSGADLSAEVGSRVDTSLRLVGKLAYAMAETSRPANPIDHRLTVIFATEFLQ